MTTGQPPEDGPALDSPADAAAPTDDEAQVLDGPKVGDAASSNGQTDGLEPGAEAALDPMADMVEDPAIESLADPLAPSDGGATGEPGAESGPEPASETAADLVRAASSALAAASPSESGTEAASGSEAEPEIDSEAEPAIDSEAEPASGSEAEPEIDSEAEPAIESTAEPAGPVTVGRMVADAIRRAGVRWAFIVPGESFLGLIDGLDAAGIHVVATRHEGAAAFMAEAHAQLTGRPAACLATRAVGAANLAIGIHTATADSSPMFALVGQVERSARGRESFQEVDLVETIGGLAKWAAEPADAAAAVEAVATAVGEATGGRPGPVLLALAEDLLDEIVPDGHQAMVPRIAPRRPSDEEVGAVLHLLADARRPVILAGGGILRARTSNELQRLAELLRVPVIAGWRRGDVISNDHPLYLGMTGYGAPPVVRQRLEEADAMLVIGCRLGEIASYGWSIPAEQTRWAHVDVAPARPAHDLRAADLTVEADAKQFLRAAISRLESRGVLDAPATDERVARNAEDRSAWEAATIVDAHPWSGPGVHPGRVISTLRAVLPDDAIVTTDAGSFGGWAARGFRFRRPGTFLGPTSGAMGYALPAAIAAGLVHRDRTVAALVGDGGLGMSLAEVETAVRMGLRTIVLVFDNEQYGLIRAYQESRDGGSTAGTDLGPLDFAAAARAMGARGIRVDSDAGVESALRQALVADRPTVVQLAVDRRWTGVDATP